MEMIREAIEVLKNGGSLLYPTDTIWGLGCDATNELAVERVATIKERPDEKSFIVLVDSFVMLEKYVPSFPEVVYDLIDLSDKPLTIIFENVTGLAPNVLAADGSVGIRLCKDPICQKLIRGIRKPIVSTSANISGEASPKSFSDVSNKVKERVDFIVKERLEEIRTSPSSIIKISNDSSIQIIRK